MIKRVSAIYFSPLGGTALMTNKLATVIASELSECSPEEIITESYNIAKDPNAEITIDDETIVVLGMPVHIGKLPLPGIKVLQKIGGEGAMTIPCVSYGGRSYGNALYELQHLAEEQDFKVVGAGAFMVSYAAVRGSQRSAPPVTDIISISEFAKAAAGKIRRLAGCEIEGLKIKPAPVEVNGKMPVHKISRISPKAAEAAQEFLQKINRRRKKSEWFL